MRSAVVLAIVCIGLLAMIRNRFAGLLLYTWFTFFRAQDWSYFELVPYRLSMVIGVGLIGTSLLSGVLPNLVTPLSAGSFLFLSWAVLTAGSAYDVDTAWVAIGNLAPTIVVMLFGISLTTTRKRLAWFVAVGAGSLAVHGCWRAVAQTFSGGAYISDGIGGSFNDNNAFGLALARVSFLLIAVMQTAGSRAVKVAAGVAVPLTVLAVTLTYSRGAFLALAAGSLVYLALQRRRIVAITLGVVAALVILAVMPEQYTERVGSITTYAEEEDRSALGRLHFWSVAIEMVKDRGVGLGLGNFEAAYDQYDFSDGAFGSRRAVHSTHFQALAETGWVGFLLFEGMMIWTLLTAARIRRRARQLAASPTRVFYESFSNAILASTVAFVVGGSFLSQVLSELNWFTFAWTAALDRLQRREFAGPSASGADKPAEMPGDLSLPASI